MTDEQTETAALSLAKSLDYPWSYMTQKGREEMRKMARDAFGAATAPLLERIAELEAKLAQRVPDFSAFETAITEYIDEYEMRGEDEDGCDACYTPNENDKALLLDAFMGFDFSPWLSAAPAAPEQQEPTDSMGIPVSCGKPLCSPGDHHPLCAQASNAQQAEPPPGWKTVVVPEDVGPEPDWEDVRYQAETATGINLPRAVFSIVIREVRRWLAAQQAEAQEPCAYLYHDASTPKDAHPWLHSTMLVLAADRRPGLRGETPLFTRPQPAQLQALSEEEAITAWRGVKDVGDDKYNAILLGEAIQSALAAKNGAVLAAAAMAPEEAK